MEIYNVGIAISSEEPNSRFTTLIEEFINGLTSYSDRLRLVLGGYWGAMKYLADYAYEKGFTLVFILPSSPRENVPRRRNFIVVSTGLDYPTRSTVLARTSDVLVALGGRVGSMIEILLAYSYGKPVVIVHGTGYDTDHLPGVFRDSIDSRYLAPLYYVENGADASSKVLEILGLK